MNNFRLFLKRSLMLMVISPSSAVADAVDYRQFVASVFERHPMVLEQVAKAKEKQAEIADARSKRLPSIKVGGIYNSQTKESAELSMRMPIYTFGRISNEIDLRGEEYRLETLRLLKVQNDVVADATELFLNYVYDSQKFGVLDRNYRELDQLLERIKRRRQSGYDSVADVNSAKSRVLQAKARADRQAIALRSMLSEISVLYGSAVADILPPPQDFFSIEDPGEFSALIMEQNPNPDIVLAEQQSVIADRQVRLVKLNNRPNIDLYGSEDLNNPFKDGGTIGIQMNYELEGLGYSVAANIESAKFRKESAIQSKANVIQETSMKLMRTLNELGAVAQQLQEQKAILNSLRDTKKSFTRQYEAGRKSLMEVLNIYNELADAEQLLLDHQRRKIGYEVSLYQLSGAIYLAALTDSLPNQISLLQSETE